MSLLKRVTTTNVPEALPLVSPCSEASPPAVSVFWPTLQLWPLSAEALEGHLEAFLQSLTLVLVLLQSCPSNIQHMHDIDVSSGPHPPLPGSLVDLLGSFLPEAL